MQVALDVAFQPVDGFVATGRFLAQALGDDRIQVADEQARSKRRFGIGLRDPAGRRRVAVQQQFQCMGRRQAAHAQRALAGEQLEQQDAERVDIVAGLPLAAELLRRGVFRREGRDGDVGIAGHGSRVEQLGDAEVRSFTFPSSSTRSWPA